MSKVTVAFVLWTMVTNTACLQYSWDPDDPLLDCIVVVEDTHLTTMWTTAVFYNKNRMITTRTGLNLSKQYWYPKGYSHMYSVNGTYYNSTMWDSIAYYYDYYCYRGNIQFSYMEYYTYVCILDDWCVFETPTDLPSASELFDIVNYKAVAKGYRQPFYFPLADKYMPEEPSNWMTASFQMVDRTHIREHNRLIPVYYTEPVLVDCDEYFPRQWGEFICIRNIDHYPGIGTAAPLIQNGHLFGIACFTLKKGKESIFVFTDLRKYRQFIDKI